jgi:hypothetical protein
MVKKYSPSEQLPKAPGDITISPILAHFYHQGQEIQDERFAGAGKCP